MKPESLGVAIAVTPAWVASRAVPSLAGTDARERVRLALIDTRSEAEFARSRIPGAILAPADSASSLEALVKMLAARGLTGEETLVCYADRASIASAAHVFWLLELAGARAVRFLDGGIESWEASGRALAKGPGALLAATPAILWRLAPDSSRVATLEYVRDHFGEKEVEIFDARGALAWESPDGQRFESQWGRAGHIPHSLPFEFRTMFRDDGALLPVDELRTAIRRSGPRPATPVSLESEIIVYDDGSEREAALGYLVARAAGVERARCFPDGWARWSADRSLPVVRIVDVDTIEARVAEETRGGRSAAESESPKHILFDMRTTNDYKSGHIPGAVLLAAHQFEDSLDIVVERMWPGVDRSQVTLTAYCYGPDCIRSRNGCTWAARRGFLHLEWFHGGIAEWESAKNPLVLGPTPDEE